jgi:hypothetical protein
LSKTSVIWVALRVPRRLVTLAKANLCCDYSIPGTLNETATAANLTQLTGALNTYAPGALQMLEANVAARGSQSQCPAGQSELCGLT